MLLLSLYEPYAAAGGGVPLEWMLLVGWALLGSGFWVLARRFRGSISEEHRRQLILGSVAEGDPSADQRDSTGVAGA